MDSATRIEAAIALEKTDRVPIAPWLGLYAASYTNLSKREFIFDNQKRFAAILQTAVELGPWDMTYMGENASELMLLAAPARIHWPGIDLPEDDIHQVVEYELLEPEDYALFERIGLLRFLREVALRQYPAISVPRGVLMAFSFIRASRANAKALRGVGIEPAAGFMHPGPLFEYFSIGRSLGPMCTDLYDRPEAVKRAGPAWARAMTRLAVFWARLVGVNRVFVALSRSSGAFISPVHFEEFVYPEIRTIVGMLIDAGMTPILHCDTRWTDRLEIFRRFPAGKCIVELDGHTDMLKVKEILGGHTCVKGNVPAALTAFGERSEVLEYCRRLIETFDSEGGFILSTGCTLPANAKTENVQAIFEAGERWGRT